MNVIAVDDEKLALKDLLEAIQSSLEDADAYGFRRPQEALEFAGMIPVDIAFLDIEMKDMNGLELAKRLKDIRGETNIVFVTGYPRYAVDAFSVCASDYIMKPALPEKITQAVTRLRNPIQGDNIGLRIQCFGNFEVFFDGTPVKFSRSKSKELFAYLVHKRGTGCSTRELCAVLFEDREYSSSLSHQIQVIISSMMKTLDEVGVRAAIIKNYNNMAVDVSRLNCDYYRFLSWDLDAINSYAGEYMANYSWAEFIVGYLDSKVLS